MNESFNHLFHFILRWHEGSEVFSGLANFADDSFLLVSQNLDLSTPRNISTFNSIRRIEELVNVHRLTTINNLWKAAEPGLSTKGLEQLRNLDDHLELLSEVGGFLSSLNLIIDVTDDGNQ